MQKVRSILSSTSLLFALLLPLSVSSHAESICNYILKFQAALTETDDWASLVATLQSATSYRLKYPLQLTSNRGVSLPVLESAFKDTRYFIGSNRRLTNNEVNQGSVIHSRVSFYYKNKAANRKELGVLNYLILSAEGNVLEVGAGSKALINEFRSHIFGRTQKPEYQNLMIDINESLYKTLSENPVANTKLKAFAEERKWPAGLEKELKLVYFNNELVPLKSWAAKHGYTEEQLKDAGWLELRFNQRGERFFVPRNNDTIKIPFFQDSKQTKPLAWRTRVLNKKIPNGPKYLSSPLNRTQASASSIYTHLYNSWKLNEVRGKTLVITEGEFKSAIATHYSGILTLGLLGITEFDDDCIQAISKAEPKEVVIVLDRDPKGKGLMRLDEVTDSERAAYSIARELELSQVKVRVGTLPDVFDGGKVGVDDLILEKGIDPYLHTIETAVAPNVYAENHGMDPYFQDLLLRRKKLNRALEKYQDSNQRGGPVVSNAIIAKTKLYLKNYDQMFEEYLQKVLKTNRRLDQPSVHYHFISQSTFLPKDVNIGMALSHENNSRKAFNNEQLQGNIILMEFTEDDLRFPLGAKVKSLPFSYRSLLGAFQNGGTGSTNVEPSLSQVLEKGWSLANATGFNPDSFDEFIFIPLAGHLNTIFPSDDYRFEFNVQFYKSFAADRVFSDVIPIAVIKKDSGKVVAMADMRKQNREPLFNRVNSYLRPRVQ